MAPLARLLKIDLNTLFGFHEDITQQEIGLLCKEVGNIVGDKGLEELFLICLDVYQFQLVTKTYRPCCRQDPMSGLTADEMRPYEEQLLEWYHRLAGSIDIKISNSANFMLASRYLRNGAYEKAQETLDLMPDRNEIVVFIIIRSISYP